MGKSRFLIILLLMSLLFLTIYRSSIGFSLRDTIYFYYHVESFSVNRLYGLTDVVFYSYFDKEIIAENEKYKIKHYNVKGGGLQTFLTVYLKDTDEEILFRDQRNRYRYRNYEHQLLDLEVFNTIVETDDVPNVEVVLKTYVMYVHNEEKIYSHSSIEFLNTCHGDRFATFTVWHSLAGIVEYEFEFEDLKILNVQSKFIGYRGDEESYWHDYRLHE